MWWRELGRSICWLVVGLFAFLVLPLALVGHPWSLVWSRYYNIDSLQGGLLDTILHQQALWQEGSIRWLREEGPSSCSAILHNRRSPPSPRRAHPDDPLSTSPRICVAIATRQRVLPHDPGDPAGPDMPSSPPQIEYFLLTLRGLLDRVLSWKDRPPFEVTRVVVLDTTPGETDGRKRTADTASSWVSDGRDCVNYLTIDSFHQSDWFKLIYPGGAQGLVQHQPSYFNESLHYSFALDSCLEASKHDDIEGVLVLQDDALIVPLTQNDLPQVLSLQKEHRRAFKGKDWAFLRLYNPPHFNSFWNPFHKNVADDKLRFVGWTLLLAGLLWVGHLGEHPRCQRAPSILWPSRSRRKLSVADEEQAALRSPKSQSAETHMTQRRVASGASAIAPELSERTSRAPLSWAEFLLQHWLLRFGAVLAASAGLCMLYKYVIDRQWFCDVLHLLFGPSLDVPGFPLYGNVAILYDVARARDFRNVLRDDFLRSEARREQIDKLIDVWAERRREVWRAPLDSPVHHLGIVSSLPEHPLHSDIWMLLDHWTYMNSLPVD
jgi:hypothetical protein